MEFWRIELAECPRLVEFPYKLLRVGSFRDWKPARVGPFRFQNELQISLRLGSEAETMENFINDTRTTNRFRLSSHSGEPSPHECPSDGIH